MASYIRIVFILIYLPFQTQIKHKHFTINIGVNLVFCRLGPPYLMQKPDPEMILQGNARYEGFSMDLIKELAEKVNFTFEFRVLPGNDRGSYDAKTKSWSGLLKEVLDRVKHISYIICYFLV